MCKLISKKRCWFLTPNHLVISALPIWELVFTTEYLCIVIIVLYFNSASIRRGLRFCPMFTVSFLLRTRHDHAAQASMTTFFMPSRAFCSLFHYVGDVHLLSLFFFESLPLLILTISDKGWSAHSFGSIKHHTVIVGCPSKLFRLDILPSWQFELNLSGGKYILHVSIYSLEKTWFGWRRGEKSLYYKSAGGRRTLDDKRGRTWSEIARERAVMVWNLAVAGGHGIQKTVPRTALIQGLK